MAPSLNEKPSPSRSNSDGSEKLEKVNGGREVPGLVRVSVANGWSIIGAVDQYAVSGAVWLG